MTYVSYVIYSSHVILLAVTLIQINIYVVLISLDYEKRNKVYSKS